MALNLPDYMRQKPEADSSSSSGLTLPSYLSRPKPTTAPAEPPNIQRPQPSGLLRRTVGDTAVDLGRGIIGVGEAAVGLANIPTFGYAGKGLEAIGYDPKTTKEMIGELHSPERKAALAEVDQAEGFTGTAKAMLRNPSTIAGAVAESAPSILGGGAIARGLGAVSKLSRPVRAAIGEGAVGAGGAAEGIRQETEDGTLSGKQVAAALGTGATTALLGYGGGRLAQRLGIGDVDTVLAGAGRNAIRGPTQTPGLARRTLQGAATEGVLEEMPQSATEQMWQNLALDRPLTEGVPESAAAGMLTGTAIGGPFAALSRPRPTVEPAPDIPDDITGARARSLDRMTPQQREEMVASDAASAARPEGNLTDTLRQQQAGQLMADIEAAETPADRAAAEAALAQFQQETAPQRPKVTADAITAQAQLALDELNERIDGTPDKVVHGLDGKPVTVRGKPAQYVGREVVAQRDWLAANIGNPQALAESAGFELESGVQQAIGTDRLAEQEGADGNVVDGSPAPATPAGAGIEAGGEAVPGGDPQRDGAGIGVSEGTSPGVQTDLAGAGSAADTQPALSPGQLFPRAAPRLPDGSPVPDPAAGPLSRAVNKGVASGAVATQSVPPAPVRPAPGSVVPPVAPPWVDESTGEIGQPAPDLVREAVQRQTEASTESATEGNPVMEIPVAGLVLSEDVPQFKSGASDETGVVEPLGGSFDRRGVGPIQVWRRNDGRMEVISGRHRLDLARRSGESTIPAQVYDESSGFTAGMAASLDAELNIRDGQGKVKDYVQFFQQPAFDGEEGRQAADARGLLARATGRRAYTIASQGSPELIAAHSVDQVTDEAAVQVAQAAPNNEALQNLGLKLLADGRPINVAVNTMHAAKAMQGPAVENGDLFGFDDSAIQDAVKMAGVAVREQRTLADRIAAIRGASKRPDLARKEGVDVRNPKALESRLRDLTAEKARWENWSSHPDLVGMVRQELGIAEPTQADPAQVNPEPESIEIDPSQQGFELRSLAEPTNDAPPQSPQDGLFAPPTRREELDAEIARRDAARNGQTATGRTDMMAGDGELFAGPRPEQTDIEQQAGRPRDDIDVQREEYEARRAETAKAAAGKAAVTKRHRAERLAVLGERWKVADSDFPSKHTYKRKDGDLVVLVAEGRYAQGAFEVTPARRRESGTWEHVGDGARYFNDFAEAAAYANNVLASPSTDRVEGNKKAVSIPRETVEPASAENARERITPDTAAEMRSGDIVVDDQGNEYRAHTARHDWLEAHPIINGRADVSADSRVMFLLTPSKAGAYPNRRNVPIYATGRNIHDQPDTPSKGKPSATGTIESRTDPETGNVRLFSRPDTASRDAEYRDAVERGDMESAQRMVNEAAEQAGYQADSDHRMSHRAPNSEDDVSLADVRTSGLVPDDYWTHPQWYTTDPRERAAMSELQALFRRMDAREASGKAPGGASIIVYRAVPKSVKEGAIRNGDWVSPSENYARDEGASIPGGYRIISQRVSAKNLWWDGNSAAELGYDDGKGYAYRNTKNNRKLLDAVTRDDDGNVIPLSRRFQARNSDARFSHPGQPGPRFLTSAADVQAAVRQVLDGWKGDKPVVRVVQTVAEARARGAKLPADAPTDFEGWWDGNTTVWIVAGNNRDVNRALEVLSHEAIGHYGIERIMEGKDWARLVADVKRLRGLKQSDVSPKIWQVLQSAKRRYGQENDMGFAKEFLAIMSEQGVRSGLTSRVVAKIRQFLAKIGIPVNIGKTFREAELLAALHAGRQRVTQGERGARQPSGRQPARAMAFSQSTPTFYSAMLESVSRAQGLPRAGATAAQWKGWLDGAIRRGEFKQSERDWLGVDSWLAGRDKVTPQELADFIRANEVQVEDVVLGGNVTDGLTDAERSRYDELHERALNTFPRDFTPAEAAEYDALLAKRKVRDDSRYSSYQLPGGENYRELLLTLPARNGRTVEQERRLQYLIEEYGHDLSLLGDDLRSEIESIQSLPDLPNFQSGHFDQPNILAHVRFNERTDSEGRRVLFLEELQSDWAQSIRKQGLGADPEVVEQDGKFMVRDRNSGEFVSSEFGPMTFSDRRFAQQQADSMKGRGLPNMPFKATDEWAMLAFKRMVRMAAEQGFDRIAWTTGEIQAERYDLSKQVDRIDYTKTPSGDIIPEIFQAGGGKVPLPKRVYSPDELADVVGKEIAERIANDGNDGSSAKMRSLSGDGLKVGGEGMRGFYDAILPKAVNKWAKPFGAKTGRADFGGDVGTTHAIDLTPKMRDAALGGLPMFSRPDSAALNGVEYANGQEALTSWLASWSSALRLGGSRPRPVESRPEAVGQVARNESGAAEQGDASREEIREQSQRLIERAKAEGFFWGDGSPILADLDNAPAYGGAEHRAYIVGEGDNRFVIRATDNGSFGPRSDISPAQYLARLDDYSSTFPNLQTRLIGVSESAEVEGNAVIWTAQPYVRGTTFRNQPALAAAMRAHGWEQVGDDQSFQFRHTQTGAVIEDAHTDNVFQDDNGDLYPFDVVMEALPNSGRFSRPDPNPKTPASAEASVSERLTGAVRNTLDAVAKKTGRGQAKRPDWVSDSVAGKFDTFSGKKPTKQWLDELKENAGLRLAQRIFDQYRAMRNYSEEGFMQAHLSRATDGTLETVFNNGIPILKDGAYYVDEKNGGLKGLLSRLGGVEEAQRFFMWIAGNRSEKLAGEGRENLFTSEDIKEMKAYNAGKLADGRNRKQAYDQALREFNRFQRAILDIAERAGEISPESRALWQSEFYIPFYRVAEETGQPFSPGNAGLARQNVVKKLKGGTEKLGDPLENVLSNWSAMLSASMRNMAANKTLNEAVRLGAAERVPAGTKGATWTMVDGKQQHWMVHDKLLAESLEAMNFTGYNNPAMKLAGKFKRMLSVGVTVNPSYRIRNLTRDLVSALATADTGDVNAMNPLASLSALGKNIVRGAELTARDSNTNIQLTAGGGAVRFGLMNDGDQAANAKKLIAMGVNENQILDTPSKIKNAIRRAWDKYQELGDRAETINRAVIYDRAIKAGRSHLQASFEARDLMNFTSMGSSAAVRALAQVLPFFNARLQGLDKLGRAAKNDPRRFWPVAGHVAMASALLYMLQGDDDEYQALPDYVRDTYWPVKLGGTWVYIPKPFELGSLGTVVERGAELMMAGDDYQAKDFRDSMVSILTNTLAMNPVPQIIKPVGEAWFNYDMFRNAPIDSMAQQRLLPQDRFTARTSGAAVLAGQAVGVSPQKIEHMVKGYLGWIGIQALNVGDLLARDAAGLPSNPNRDMTSVNNWLVAGDFVKEAGSTPSKYLERFYESQKALDQIYATATQARRAGDTERALELLNDPTLRTRPAFQAADRRITRINQSIRSVTADRSLSAAEKNRRLENLRKQREEVAKRVDRLARAAG